MLVFLDGRFVPGDRAVVSVLDRGFLYGDGLFETMRVRRGNPQHWNRHAVRLTRGAEFLQFQLPYTIEFLRQQALELIRLNQSPDAILRLHISRGVGNRGYSPRGANHPTCVMSLHPAPPVDAYPPTWKLVTSSVTVPTGQDLTLHKTSSKLHCVLARAEADSIGADEALLQNTEGNLAEGTSSNLFWVDQGIVCTPPLDQGALDGITRGLVLEWCAQQRIRCDERTITSPELRERDGVFLTLSSHGIVEAISLDGHALHRCALVGQIQHGLAAAADTDTE